MTERSSRARVALKLVVGVVGAASVFFGAGVALAAASFSDTPGDNNAAPDVTTVAVSETPDGNLTIAATIANYQALPANSWVNLWFDLDSNPHRRRRRRGARAGTSTTAGSSSSAGTGRRSSSSSRSA